MPKWFTQKPPLPHGDAQIWSYDVPAAHPAARATALHLLWIVPVLTVLWFGVSVIVQYTWCGSGMYGCAGPYSNVSYDLRTCVIALLVSGGLTAVIIAQVPWVRARRVRFWLGVAAGATPAVWGGAWMALTALG